MRPLEPSEIRKIAVRATNWLGDAVMTTPALGVLRAFFPKASISLVAIPSVAELFRGHPWVDELVIYDRRQEHSGISGRWKMARTLRAGKYDLYVVLPPSLDAGFLAWLSGVPRRVGFSTEGRGVFLSHAVPASKRRFDRHESWNYVDLLREVGVAGPVPPQTLYLDPAEKSAVGELLARHGIGPDDCVIGVNPGAAYGSAKRWYPERFAAAALTLSRQWGAKVVVVGGSAEAGMADEVLRNLEGIPAVNLVGKTTVRELLGVVQRCNFFLTNDSGPMHVAAAFGVPMVAVFGSTNHLATFPLSDNASIVRHEVDCAPCMKRTCPIDHRCMTGITADKVVKAALSLGTRFGYGKRE